MSDQERGTPAHDFAEAAIDLVFGLRVKGRRWLIEDEQIPLLVCGKLALFSMTF